MFKKTWVKFLKILGRIKIYKYPLWMIYDPKGYKMTDADDKGVLSIVKAGDVLLRGYTDFLDGYLIPGIFSHAGIYIGDGEVIHSMQDGVFQEGITRFMRCDYMAVIRPDLPAKPFKKEAIERAKSMIGTPYDFFGDFHKHDRVCCTELVQCAYEPFAGQLGMQLKQYRIGDKLIMEAIAPDDFLYFSGFKPIFFSSYYEEHYKNRG